MRAGLPSPAMHISNCCKKCMSRPLHESHQWPLHLPHNPMASPSFNSSTQLPNTTITRTKISRFLIKVFNFNHSWVGYTIAVKSKLWTHISPVLKLDFPFFSKNKRENKLVLVAWLIDSWSCDLFGLKGIKWLRGMMGSLWKLKCLSRRKLRFPGTGYCWTAAGRV